jgi:hypothetical protein
LREGNASLRYYIVINSNSQNYDFFTLYTFHTFFFLCPLPLLIRRRKFIDKAQGWLAAGLPVTLSDLLLWI